MLSVYRSDYVGCVDSVSAISHPAPLSRPPPCVPHPVFLSPPCLLALSHPLSPPPCVPHPVFLSPPCLLAPSRPLPVFLTLCSSLLHAFSPSPTPSLASRFGLKEPERTYSSITVYGLRTMYMVIFLLASVISLAFWGYFYALCLLHIIVNNDILQRVLRSVTKNGACSICIAGNWPSPCVPLPVFLSLCSSPCVPHPVFLSLCSSPCVPHPVFLSPYSSPRVPHPVFLTPCSSPRVPHPVFPALCSSPYYPHPVFLSLCSPPCVPHPIILALCSLQVLLSCGWLL